MFKLERPGLRISMYVDTDRNLVRMHSSGVTSETSKVRTSTRNVSRADLERIVGGGARLVNQFERIMTALMRDPPRPTGT